MFIYIFRELKNLLKKASNNSMFALNALTYRNKASLGSARMRPAIQQQPSVRSDFLANHKQSLIDVNYDRRRRNPRSLSALNEPYLAKQAMSPSMGAATFVCNNNQASCMRFNEDATSTRQFNTIERCRHYPVDRSNNNFQQRPSSVGYSSGSRLLKSVLSAGSGPTARTNNMNSLSSVLNRKKSKSVTFMDALGQNPNLNGKSCDSPVASFYGNPMESLSQVTLRYDVISIY